MKETKGNEVVGKLVQKDDLGHPIIGAASEEFITKERRMEETKGNMVIGKLVPEDDLSHQIIGAAIEVHKILGGPGLLESVYEEAMVWELMERGLNLKRQVQVPITYKGNQLATPLRIDLLVEDLIIVENKAMTKYNSIYATQTLTYLRLMNLRLGLVINFGEKYVKHGIHRVPNLY